MCIIPINIKTEKDLYFAISNTILSLNKESFKVSDIMQKLKENNISNDSESIKEISNNNLVKYVEISIDNLIEHGKVIEEPRVYKLANMN